MYSSSIDFVNTQLSAKRRGFVLRGQDGSSVPMFDSEKYCNMDDSLVLLSPQINRLKEISDVDYNIERCFNLNLSCNSVPFSSSQNESEFNESTLVNSTIDPVPSQHSLLPIEALIPIDQGSFQVLECSKPLPKKRVFDSGEIPLPKRQDTHNKGQRNLVSSDFISSDSFGHITITSDLKNDIEEDLFPLPHFSDNEVFNMIASSFDPIFSED